MASAQDYDLPRSHDFNTGDNEGVGYFHVNQRSGWRVSTAKAFLKPVSSRPNLTVFTKAHVLRLELADKRAGGVIVRRDGEDGRLTARGEVILAAGSLGSPQILQLSGIGAADPLAKLGITPRVDLPGVGANLQDHIETYVQHACTQPISLHSTQNPAAKALIGLRWLLLRTGLGATNHFESGGFIRSRAGVRHPDLQFHFLPIAMAYDGKSQVDQHGFQAHVGPMRPSSRGAVTLASADPRQPPRIRFNYLATDDDRREFRDGVRLTREIFAQKAFDPYRGPELSPGLGVRSDAEIDAHLRRKAESAYHPSCSCRMGADGDPMAVVDGQLRVRGVEALRVADASVMPRVASGNLNAPTIMIAEKAADMILGRPPLPPTEVPVFVHPQWRTAQR